MNPVSVVFKVWARLDEASLLACISSVIISMTETLERFLGGIFFFLLISGSFSSSEVSNVFFAGLLLFWEAPNSSSSSEVSLICFFLLGKKK